MRLRSTPGYDPTLDNQRLIGLIHERFPISWQRTTSRSRVTLTLCCRKEKLESATPPEVARRIDVHADAALEGLQSLKTMSTLGTELVDTLSDIRAMALLGKYYAAKIRGATELELYRRSGVSEYQKRAISSLLAAQTHWLEYSTLAGSKYMNPLWTNRVGYVDWKELNAEVARDVQIAQQETAAPNRLTK